ncbi:MULTISPECIES: class A beta-lactamase [Staphylococcus]|uniref:Beta-lactamase n=2 Tax=Staphylococcus TaxID=1279 RepID=Q49V79_STAS1|nr:BlaZ family class A beta-lactamase [Staphylococcus saprophyticus]OFK26285.1 BlaZ family class A beta-lactamase [Staphylococcus sp. HMSC068H12]OOC95993.1 class A beta-lactamase [Staphylococcus saprophyticus subsp. saprophyticus ATCC 15305 = NCTC 7292]CRV25793.1 Beta-lactamase precursor [Streptococcus equi subsp. equi]OEK24089.1 BlaZ family class A beta-lactamase [Staphylococcus saprophyticus]
MINQYIKKWFIAFVLSSVCLIGLSSMHNTTFAKDIEQIENEYNTKVGIYGINTENGKAYQHNADERFTFASTYKAIASGILLNKVAPSELNKKVEINESEIVANSPVTEQYIGKTMSLKALIKASMLQSDNTANNKIMQELGGVNGLKHELVQLGDDVSEPQRLEPELNYFDPNSKADTTTPRAAAQTLNSILTSNEMNESNLSLLKQTMIENKTGDTLIKAGMPNSYTVGDKSGQALTYATRNDLAFIYPKGQDKPIILAIYSKQDQKDAKPNDKVISDSAREVIKYLK